MIEMKYTDTLNAFLEDAQNKHLRIVTKVGTISEGFLQTFGKDGILVSDRSTTLIDVKDIASIEETWCTLSDYLKHPDRDAIETNSPE